MFLLINFNRIETVNKNSCNLIASAHDLVSGKIKKALNLPLYDSVAIEILFFLLSPTLTVKLFNLICWEGPPSSFSSSVILNFFHSLYHFSSMLYKLFNLACILFESGPISGHKYVTTLSDRLNKP